MTYSRSLNRRLERLEAVPRVLSTEDKWTRIEARVSELLSEKDLRMIQELENERAVGVALEPRPDWEEAVGRYDEACTRAVADLDIRFTISEFDQLLAE